MNAARTAPALLAIAALACAHAQPPRKAHEAPWGKAAAVFVDEATEETSNVPPMVTVMTTRQASEALTEAGFRVVSEPAREAIGLHLTWTGRGELQADFRRDGRPITTIVADVDRDGLDCYTWQWGVYPEQNSQCLVDDVLTKAARSAELGVAIDAALREQALAAHQQRPKPRQDGASNGAAAATLAGKLAVLELRSLSPEVSDANARYFTDLARTASLQAAPRLEVMTRENIVVLLQSSGKTLQDCEGECEVDTGRRLGADLIVSGELQKVGNRLKISIRLHETKEGRLLSSVIASGNSMDELDDAAINAVERLYSQLHPTE